MKTVRTLFLTVCCILAALTTPVFASTSGDAWQSEASALYESGDYGKAHKKYLKLGKKGDVFSSYRVSYMYLKGQGTKNDIVEAMAWAVLAAESGAEDLVSYRNAIAALVPENKRKKAQSKADYYVRRWGPKKDDGNRKPDNSVCTSSRIKSSCDKMGPSSSVWIAWPRVVKSVPEVSDTIEKLNAHIAAGSILDSAAGDS